MVVDTSSSSSLFIEPTSFSKDWIDITCFQERSRNNLYIGTRYGRRFLLKSIRKEYQDYTEYNILHDKEFKLGISLNHPNIAKTYEMEYVDGIGMCIVQEYIDGVTLGAWIQKNPSVAARKKVLNQLLKALKYIHSLQVVHHDLKLGNIMVTHQGNNVKLIDFGLSNTDDAVSAIPNDQQEDIVKLGEIINVLFDGQYSRIAHKCLQKNFTTIEAVEKAVNKRNRLPWVIAVALFAGVVLAFSLYPVAKENYQQYQTEQYKKEALVVLDSAYSASMNFIETFPYYECAMQGKVRYVNYVNACFSQLTPEKYAGYFMASQHHVASIDSALKTLPSLQTLSAEKRTEVLLQLQTHE